MTPTLYVVLLWEIALAALVWTAFAAHYQCTTRGRWRRTQHGRNVMSLAVCLAVMTNLTLLSVVLDGAWIVWAALVLWPALALVGLHRHRLLWQDQHREED